MERHGLPGMRDAETGPEGLVLCRMLEKASESITEPSGVLALEETAYHSVAAGDGDLEAGESNGMSTRCTDIVWQELDVSGPEKLLLLAIADISNHEGDNIHPSNDYLVWLTGIPLRTVQLYKARWKESGALLPIENEKGGAGNFVRYLLNLDVFPRKTEWERKGARTAFFRKRRKDVATASLAPPKGAVGAPKGAVDDEKGCSDEQCNKEEPLEEPKANQNQHGLRRDEVEVWLKIKEELKTKMHSAEWELWVRPARLLRVMSGNVMMIAFPPSGNIMRAAVERKKLLWEVADKYGYDTVQTVYPDDWQREELKERFGIDMTPKSQKKLFPAKETA
jgi:hypothetical protein